MTGIVGSVDNKVLILRHSESTYNAAGRWAGWEDCPLTDRGVDRAHEIGARLRASPVSFGAVVTSDLQRARHGGQIIAEHLGVPLLPADRRWRERNAGLFQGRLVAELETDPQYRAWKADPRQALPSGESHIDFLYRLIAGLVEALRVSGSLGSPVVVVAHDGVQQALSEFLNRPGYPFEPLEGFWV